MICIKYYTQFKNTIGCAPVSLSKHDPSERGECDIDV